VAWRSQFHGGAGFLGRAGFNRLVAEQRPVNC